MSEFANSHVCSSAAASGAGDHCGGFESAAQVFQDLGEAEALPLLWAGFSLISRHFLLKLVFLSHTPLLITQQPLLQFCCLGKGSVKKLFCQKMTFFLLKKEKKKCHQDSLCSLLMFQACGRATPHTVQGLLAGVFPLRRMMSHNHSSFTARLILTACPHQKHPQMKQTARTEQIASA